MDEYKQFYGFQLCVCTGEDTFEISWADIKEQMSMIDGWYGVARAGYFPINESKDLPIGKKLSINVFVKEPNKYYIYYSSDHLRRGFKNQIKFIDFEAYVVYFVLALFETASITDYNLSTLTKKDEKFVTWSQYKEWSMLSIEKNK